jgi:MYXO-CTERM domain-containing protein
VDVLVGPRFSVAYWASEVHRFRPRVELAPRARYHVRVPEGSTGPARDLGSFQTGDGPELAELPAPAITAKVGPAMNCMHPAPPLVDCLGESDTLFPIQLGATANAGLYTIRVGGTLVAEGLPAPLWGVAACAPWVSQHHGVGVLPAFYVALPVDALEVQAEGPDGALSEATRVPLPALDCNTPVSSGGGCSVASGGTSDGGLWLLLLVALLLTEASRSGAAARGSIRVPR